MRYDIERKPHFLIQCLPIYKYWYILLFFILSVTYLAFIKPSNIYTYQNNVISDIKITQKYSQIQPLDKNANENYASNTEMPTTKLFITTSTPKKDIKAPIFESEQISELEKNYKDVLNSLNN